MGGERRYRYVWGVVGIVNKNCEKLVFCGVSGNRKSVRGEVYQEKVVLFPWRGVGCIRILVALQNT